MRHTLRSLLVAATVVVGGSVHAQPLPPFQVTVTVSLAGCPANATGNLQTLSGTLPAQDIDFAFWQGGSGSCSASLDLLMDSFSGSFVVTVPCSGALLIDTVDYQINTLGGLDSAFVLVWLDCGAPPAPDCLGVPGGSALPGTPCVTVGGAPGTWNEECQCVFSSGDCNACFTVSQALDGNGDPIPFTAAFSNCSSGGTAPITYVWDFPSTAQTAFETTYTYSGAGTWFACLNMNAAGCTSNLCDTVVFDMNGMLVDSVVVYDCLQIANGPNLPGTPCTNPATGETGTWSADCTCITNSTGCQAGFWVIQAYEGDSLSGEVTPIPYELWVWNLSSGTSPFQFLWNFGDGTTSTDPYPTHVYAQSGPYNLCLTMTDASGCTSTSCDSVSIDGNGLYDGMAPVEEAARNGFTIRVVSELPTGIADQPAFNDTRLWPNPVNEVLNLRFNTTLRGNLPMSVVDVNGRVVLSANAMIADGTNQLEIATGSLPAGMYMLRMGSGQETMSFRFVKN